MLGFVAQLRGKLSERLGRDLPDDRGLRVRYHAVRVRPAVIDMRAPVSGRRVLSGRAVRVLGVCVSLRNVPTVRGELPAGNFVLVVLWRLPLSA
jgi:hypothetical protein